MMTNIMSDASAQSDWDAHFNPWIDGRDLRAAGPLTPSGQSTVWSKRTGLALSGIAPCTYDL